MSINQSLLLAVEQRVDGRIELVAALEEVELENEDVAQQRATEFLDERSSCSCGATCPTTLALSEVIWSLCNSGIEQTQTQNGNVTYQWQ